VSLWQWYTRLILIILSMLWAVSGRLAEAFAKNSKPKGFEDIVPTTLHEYADIFSETAFNSLPEHRK
jgi:hypothetical protein